MQIGAIQKGFMVKEVCRLGAGERIELPQLLGREDPVGQAASISGNAVTRLSRSCLQVNGLDVTRAEAVSRGTGE